jgi:hypothetical protein
MSLTKDQRALAAYKKGIGLDVPRPTYDERSAAISERRGRELRDSRIMQAGYDPSTLTSAQRFDAYIEGCAINSAARKVQSAAAKGRRHQRTKLALTEPSPATIDQGLAEMRALFFCRLHGICPDSDSAPVIGQRLTGSDEA